MIGLAHVRTMAAYNKWQNNTFYLAADTLDDGARRLELGAFLGSIHGTLSHLLWEDRTWMNRICGNGKADTVKFYGIG